MLHFANFAIFFLASMTTVLASPKPDVTVDIEARVPSCTAGQAYSTAPPGAPGCRPCPAGSFCTGGTEAAQICPAGSYCPAGAKAAQACDSGTYSPNQGRTSCIETIKGWYQPNKGQTYQIPCSPGTYQPNTRQAFCFGAPSGRFQGFYGQSKVCGACCGWATTQTNLNTFVYKCSGSTPYSGQASGSGCVKDPVGCTPAASCYQNFDGSCPDLSYS